MPIDRRETAEPLVRRGELVTGLSFVENYQAGLNAEISTYPFTTKASNEGTTYVFDICVHTELSLKDDAPYNSTKVGAAA